MLCATFQNDWATAKFEFKVRLRRISHIAINPCLCDPNAGSFDSTWWRHQMETFSALLVLCAGNSPVFGESYSQRSVTRSFGVFFDMCLNKQLSKRSWGWWFETPSLSLWRHCNDWLGEYLVNVYRMQDLWTYCRISITSSKVNYLWISESFPCCLTLLTHFLMDSREQITVKFESKYISKKNTWTGHLRMFPVSML